jgi:hypothetical protein
MDQGGSIQSPFSAVRRADACFCPNPQQGLVRGILRVGLTALKETRSCRPTSLTTTIRRWRASRARPRRRRRSLHSGLFTAILEPARSIRCRRSLVRPADIFPREPRSALFVRHARRQSRRRRHPGADVNDRRELVRRRARPHRHGVIRSGVALRRRHHHTGNLSAERPRRAQHRDRCVQAARRLYGGRDPVGPVRHPKPRHRADRQGVRSG